MAYARRLRLMLSLSAAALAAALGFNFLANPLGAWHHRLVPDIYMRLNHERVTTPYLLRTAHPQTLLLGASRVLYGMRIEQGVKDGFENAALSGATLEEISKEVDLALRNPRLKRIIWGVEFYTFDSFNAGCDPETCARLNGSIRLKLTDSIMSGDAVVQSWRLVVRAATHKLKESARIPIPWPRGVICRELARPQFPTLASLSPAHRFRQVTHLLEYRRFDYSQEQMERFLDIVDRIRRAHVQLLFFVPPLTEFELEMMRQNGRWPDYQRWKRDLAAHFSYLDFSGYNELARSDAMFSDVWHMKAAAGAVIMRQVLGLPDCECPEAGIVTRSGLRITTDNVDETVALQERRMMAATAEPNRYSRIVAAAIIKRYGAPVAALSASR
jgi:hypothetical protein